MINVLIVDDSLTTREYISYIIDQDPELRLVGAARNGQEAIQLVASASPDVVIMDIHMPGMDGYKATRTIMDPAGADHHSQFPGCPRTDQKYF